MTTTTTKTTITAIMIITRTMLAIMIAIMIYCGVYRFESILYSWIEIHVAYKAYTVFELLSGNSSIGASMHPQFILNAWLATETHFIPTNILRAQNVSLKTNTAILVWGIYLFWAWIEKFWADTHQTRTYNPKCHTPFPAAPMSLLWRHNGHSSVSNHQPHDCLHSRLLGRRSK